ncbi:ATP synthase subunit I [Paenibacillus allorhizosphaerae]|uniref:ATP synthase subunit I n=1 Tax=Paenibacillus allorhizosphaerae TaxID=2849866 RepID=A0ABM8VRS6_9BACL|nr:ATP synthase subunit I [Paenibacillus allorhizosphaerae]CAG7655623.1 hypothetical protein PAECIP111802_06163 [Paenibacillus allorhizosphaerae]
MDDFKAHLKTVQNVFYFFLSLCLVCWAMLVDYRPYFAGLMLGAFVSLVNAKYLAWKIHKLTDTLPETTSKRKMNMGFLTRAALATLAAVLALKYKQHFSLHTVIAGYFFIQLATLVLGFISIKKQK